MKLPAKELYRDAEIIFGNDADLQRFKQLTENCSNLETDVKYKEAVPIAPRPTIINCNGYTPGDICPHFNTELPALKNRCVFLLMKKPVVDRLSVSYLH